MPDNVKKMFEDAGEDPRGKHWSLIGSSNEKQARETEIEKIFIQKARVG